MMSVSVFGHAKAGIHGGGHRRSVSLILAAVLFAGLLMLVLPASAGAITASVVRSGPGDRPRIALTFDDNFRPGVALPALEALQRYHCKATMFVVGQYVRSYPAIAQEMAQGPFEVGDHSGSHLQLTTLDYRHLFDEVGAGTAAYRQVTGGRTVPLFRPPYGSINDRVRLVAGDQGFTHLVLWDIDPNDWKGHSAATITSHVLSRAHNGAIVLLHLSAPHTYEALPGIITGLRKKGYELVTVSELLKGNRRFVDVAEDDEAGRAILRLVKANYMSGYDADWFGPTDPMTRAQFSKVASLVTGIHTDEVESADDPTFVDVPILGDGAGNPLAYPFDFIEEVNAWGIMGGKNTEPPLRFDPQGRITRLQLAQIVARMAREFRRYPADFPGADVTYADVPEYARADVQLATRLGLMVGKGNGIFDSWRDAPRKHVAVVMSRFLDLPAYAAPVATTTTVPPATTSTTLPAAVTTSSTPTPAPAAESPTTTEPTPTTFPASGG